VVDGVQDHPNSAREERGPEEDAEDWATTNSILEALEVLVLELVLELELELVTLDLVVHHPGIDRQPDALDAGLARSRYGPERISTSGPDP
jgi:hypothetical protein